ncbi:BapA/Bap/LapF family large adhesin [Halomonas sp. 3D7M]|uniref:BapA/Bap/LapF family large adhesin n=1 Tax=Halomonas sp. 3D7M TaxID=2742617 RepID=UPI0018673209|nr:BapA/Bap/LapF family large adhesin [Halomonas sp. 3D7M]
MGTATADAGTGSYSVELDPALADGEEVTVTATDGSGNESEPTTAIASDTTAPDAPTAEFNADGDMVTGDAEPSSSTPATAPDTTAPNLPGVTIGNGDAFLTTDDLDEDGNVEVTIDLTDTNAEIGDTLTVNGVETTLTEEHINAEEVVTEVEAPEGGGTLEVTAHLADAVGNVSAPGTASATALIDGEATANLGNQTSLDYTPDSTSEVQVIDLLDSFPEDAGTTVIVGDNEDFNAFSGDLEVEVSQVGLLAVAGAFRVDVYDAGGNLVHTAATADSPLVGDVAGLGILGLTDDGALTTKVTGLEPGQYQVIVRSDESALNQLVGDLTLSELGDSGVVLGEENQEVVLGAVEDALNGTVPVLDLLGLGLGTVVVGILEPVLDTTTELGAGELVDTIVGGLNDLGLTYLVDEVLDAVADALLTETLTLLEQTEITTTLTEHGLEGDGIAEGTVDTGAGVVGSVITEVANSSGQTVQLEAGTATIAGLYGDLVINEDGSYTYTANGDIASLNQQETFTYTVSDGDSQAEAELTVTIEGEIPFSASDDTATIDIEWTNVTDNDFHQDEGSASSVLLVLNLPYEGEEFEIEPNMELSGVVIASSSVNLLGGGNLNIQRLDDNENWETVHSQEFGNLVGVANEVASIDIAGLDLDPGTYRVHSQITGVTADVNIDGSFAATYLDQFESAFVPVSGNLLDNDEAIGASLEILEPDTGDYVEIGDEPITIEGDYGSLTVDANGNYSYTPNGDLEHFTEPHSEAFVYQLTHPNGSTSEEATLIIELEAVDGEASQLDDEGIAAMSTFSLSDMDFGDDTEELVFPESEDSNEEEEQVTSGTDGFEEVPMGDFSEPKNPLDDEFDQTPMI